MKGATVYRFFADDGELLYVGCSGSVVKRIEQHRHTRDWWPRVSVVTVEHFPSLAAGRAAEREAIGSEAPAYNVQDRHVQRSDQRREAIAARYATGETMESIGFDYGISRERVRQLLADVGITGAEAAAQRRDARALEELMRRCESAQPCAVCGAWVLWRRASRACSPECVVAWNNTAVRYQLDAEFREDHRRRQAKSILRHADNRTASQVAWATRMLSDTPPQRNRSYTVPGSKASEALESVRAS